MYSRDIQLSPAWCLVPMVSFLFLAVGELNKLNAGCHFFPENSRFGTPETAVNCIRFQDILLPFTQ